MSISESIKQKIPESFKLPLRIALRGYRRIYGRVILLSPQKCFKVAKFKKIKNLKLNVGCGKVKFPGWVNIDIEPGADLVMDIRKGLPFDNNSVDFIYCEHVLEHFTYEEGEKVLREFERCLRRGGIVRIMMPDLDQAIKKYKSDWKNQDWLSWPEYKFVKTRRQMTNISFRWWGHKYLYNEEDLKNQLVKTGFQKIVRCEQNKSNYTELCNLETRKGSRIIKDNYGG